MCIRDRPTAALRGRLSAGLGMTLSELVAAAEQGGGRLARAAEQPTWTDPVSGYRRRAVSPRAGGALELVEVDFPANPTPEPCRYLVAIAQRNSLRNR